MTAADTIRESKRAMMANPTYRLAAVEATLAERERELLQLKGRCSNPSPCRLHYAHSGPCDESMRMVICAKCGMELPFEETNEHTRTHR